MDEALALERVDVRLGGHLALVEVSLRVAIGGFVAILGPNGAGKSTLLKAILGVLPLASGRLTLFGRPPRAVPPQWIGYVPQLKALDRHFPAVTCDLVASGLHRRWPGVLRRRDHQQATAVLKLVGAEHLCHKPLGWLSGGELQRVYLARAMVRRPRLLLLDEPATGIDMLGEDDMYRYLEDYLAREAATVLMVTHDWLAAKHHATQALLLNRRLVSFGPPAEALGDEHLRAAFSHVGHEHEPPEEPHA